MSNRVHHMFCWLVVRLLSFTILEYVKRGLKAIAGQGARFSQKQRSAVKTREKSAPLCSRSSHLREACSPCVCRDLYSPNTGGCEVTNDFSDQQIEAFCFETKRIEMSRRTWCQLSSPAPPPLLLLLLLCEVQAQVESELQGTAL